MSNHPLHRPNPLDEASYRRSFTAHAGEVQAEVMPIVRALTEVRLAWGLSQTEISKRMGYAANEICRAESGQRQPSLAMLIKWADVLGFELGLKSKPVE